MSLNNEIKKSLFIYFIVAVTFYLPLYGIYAVTFNNYNLLAFLGSLLKWDSDWYITIAQSGYPPIGGEVLTRSHLVYHWPPLYPLILRLTNLLIRNYSLTVFFLQNSFLALMTFFLLRIFRSLGSRDETKIVLLFLSFPISLFLYTGYTEGLSILILSLFVYHLLKERHRRAAILGSLLPLVRYNGLLFIGLLNLVYIYKNRSSRKRFIGKLFLLNSIFLLPFLIWMTILYLKTGDFLFFYTLLKSDIAFEEWNAYRYPFYHYFLSWVLSVFSGNSSHIEYKLQGFFVIFYVWLNILLIRTKSIKEYGLVGVFAFFGIIFNLAMFTVGIESLWRYGYIYFVQFLSFERIRGEWIFFLVLILELIIKLIFGTAFMLGYHIT